MADPTTTEVSIEDVAAHVQYTAIDYIAILQAEAGRADVTIPGGYGLATDGTTTTNNWGHPVDEFGTVTDETLFVS